MFPRVVAVRALVPHKLFLRFEDGAEGEVDIAAMLTFEGVFEPLRDPAFFAQVQLEPDWGTIGWPNGVDLDPLVLHSMVTGQPIAFEHALPHKR